MIKLLIIQNYNVINNNNEISYKIKYKQTKYIINIY